MNLFESPITTSFGSSGTQGHLAAHGVFCSHVVPPFARKSSAKSARPK